MLHSQSSLLPRVRAPAIQEGPLFLVSFEDGPVAFSQHLGSRKKCAGPFPRSLVITLKPVLIGVAAGINLEDVYPENSRSNLRPSPNNILAC